MLSILTEGSVQGQVLNQTSAWWMHHTEHITPNALLSIPDPNVAIMKKCKVLPIEFVVRGFMTGVYICVNFAYSKAGYSVYTAAYIAAYTASYHSILWPPRRVNLKASQTLQVFA